jgi:hypothetical protein
VAQGTVDIFVRPNHIETTGDGSYGSPFGHIVKALEYANDRVADMQGNPNINIYLLGGDNHFMTNNIEHYNYDLTKSDKASNNQNIVIQPAFCDQILGGHSFTTGDADCIASTDKITVYYKMANSFYFVVPNSLTVKNILFDALDSTIAPTDSCLNENTICCELSGTTLQASALSTASCSTEFYYQVEKCSSTIGNYFFYFGYETSSSLSTPGILTIENWAFQHFFYDFTALIGINNGNGHVIVTGTTFDKFSNCGSVIRDTRELPDLPYGDTDQDADDIVFMRQSQKSMNVLKNKYFGTTMSTCTSTTCSSISISTSTFSNFNYLKSTISYNPQVISSSNMAHQGIILDLINFYGDVSLAYNTFTDMKFKYDNWDMYSVADPAITTDYVWTLSESDDDIDIYQGKSLIYVHVKSTLSITGNSFTKSNSLFGLVYVYREPAYNASHILIDGNTFTNNVALSGANAITLQIGSNDDYSSTIADTNDMPCANIKISSNTFEHNVGWFSTAATILAIWMSADDDGPLSSTSQLVTATVMKSTFAANVNTVSIVEMSETLNTDTGRFILQNNVYNQNFAGQANAIVSLYSIRNLYMNNESFTNNEWNYKEALLYYGGFTSDEATSATAVGAFSIGSYFYTTASALDGMYRLDKLENYHPSAVLYLSSINYIHMVSVTFDNNAFAETQSEYQLTIGWTSGILFDYCQGEAIFDSITFQNYKGLDLTHVHLVTGNTK